MWNGSGYLDFEKPIVELEQKIKEIKGFTSDEAIDLTDEIKKLECKAEEVKREIYSHLTAWQRTQLARHPHRPYTRDYLNLIMDSFTELCGDRIYADDKAVVGGIAQFDGQPVAVIGHQKGRDTRENLMRNFGMPHPEGYRKALRLMKMAEKFSFPIITFIDTPGAYPGIGAEERGQAGAIASNLFEMARFAVPIITVVIGEGGSGGALGLGIGNRILMQENSVYYVCSPEACGAILWKDRTRAPEAAESLRITAHDLIQLGVVDEIITEPLGGAHQNYEEAASYVRNILARNLHELVKLSKEELLQLRYEKYRAIGKFTEFDKDTGMMDREKEI